MPASAVALKTPKTSSSAVLCRWARYRPTLRRQSGHKAQAKMPTVAVSRKGGISGYGNASGKPKRSACAAANAAATTRTSNRTRSAVKTWWCRLNMEALGNYRERIRSASGRGRGVAGAAPTPVLEPRASSLVGNDGEIQKASVAERPRLKGPSDRRGVQD